MRSMYLKKHIQPSIENQILFYLYNISVNTQHNFPGQLSTEFVLTERANKNQYFNFHHFQFIVYRL